MTVNDRVNALEAVLEPYQARLARYLQDHPEAAATGVLARSVCVTCGVAMEDRVTAGGTDHQWVVVGEVERVDPWARLDAYLEAGDVAAYQAALAHRGTLGVWPWDHTHLADRSPEQLRVSG